MNQDLFKVIAETQSTILDTAILAGYRGSISHGMFCPRNMPNSIDDRDVMFVCVPSLDHYLGFAQFGSHGTIEIKQDEWDIVAYEARKFISLLEQGNPNVLCMLWLRPEHYLLHTSAGDLLIDNRDLFVGKHIYHSFTGYAHAQLHKMTHAACEGYMGQKRRELVDRFGYDCKNAQHCIRLLRMGIEFLIDGELHVMREDAQQLLEIKRGEWLLDDVKKEANRLFALAQDAYIKSILPTQPDHKKINDLCMHVIKTALRLP